MQNNYNNSSNNHPSGGNAGHGPMNTHTHQHLAALAATGVSNNAAVNAATVALNQMLVPLANTLNHHGVQAVVNHQNQFNYMYSEGSEEEVDSEG